MKNLIKMLVGTLALATALSACGGKKGSSGNAAVTPPAATSATDVSGWVSKNTWDGRLAITDWPRYRQFLIENGLCYAQNCTAIKGYLSLRVQTVEERLPADVYFSLIPRFYYRNNAKLAQYGEGFMNAGGNGFQVQYKRYDQFYGRPVTLPYGAYGQPQQQSFAPEDKTLLIILTYADATQAIANVSVQYQGVQFAAGQMLGARPTGLNLGPIGGGGYYPGQPTPYYP